MAKLQGFTQPIFASSGGANDASVFGTMKTSPEYTADVAASVNTAEFLTGWKGAVEVGYAPYIEDMNTVQRAFSYQIAYLQQEGITEWFSNKEYYKASIVKLITPQGNAQIFVSKTDNNLNNLVSDNTHWRLWLDTNATYIQKNDLSGAISTVVTDDLTPNTALVSDANGKIATLSGVSSTELSHLDGVSSNIQSQFNSANNRISARSYITDNNYQLSFGIGWTITIPQDGFLYLAVTVGSQPDSIAMLKIANSGTAGPSSTQIAFWRHNGGTAERSGNSVLIPVKAGQSIYLDWNGKGTAEVNYCYLHPFSL